VILITVGANLVSNITDSLFGLGWFEPDQWDFWGSNFLSKAIYYVVLIAFEVLFFFVYAYISGFLIITLISPILAIVSEKTEEILTGTSYPFVWKNFFEDILRGVFVALRVFIIEMMILVMLFLLAFVPLIGLITPFIAFLSASYFYGFSFMDYFNERQRLSVRESLTFNGRNKGRTIGTGIPFALVLLIPYVGGLFTGMLALNSAIVGTMAQIELSKRSQLDQISN